MRTNSPHWSDRKTVKLAMGGLLAAMLCLTALVAVPASDGSGSVVSTQEVRSTSHEQIQTTITGSAPPAISARLSKFMAEWRGDDRPFGYPTNAADMPLILAALDVDPAGPWYAYVGYHFSEDSHQARKLSPTERKEKFAETLKYVVPARDSLARALSRKPDDNEFKERLQGLRQDVAEASLEAEIGFEAVAAQAREMLTANSDTNSWNYGNVIFQANNLLGRVAMRQGQIEEAKNYLLAAGKSPGSPQLDSFGPLDLGLARGLLEKGEKDAVLEFLDLMACFWANPEKATSPNARQVATNNLQQLESWRQQIREGRIPDDFRWRK